jgi:hypothetical protein
MSAGSVKAGGLVIHSYDLGHSLYSSSIKEKFQVFLGNNFGWILPENKFVAYVSEKRVIDLYIKNNVNYTRTTHHQMPNHKLFLKETSKIKNNSLENKIKEIDNRTTELEYDSVEIINEMPLLLREKLFPTVCVWGKKI